jgi:hypothetical protein
VKVLLSYIRKGVASVTNDRNWRTEKLNFLLEILKEGTLEAYS